MNLSLLAENLTNPALLFFVLGILAVTLKSDLEGRLKDTSEQIKSVGRAAARSGQTGTSQQNQVVEEKPKEPVVEVVEEKPKKIDKLKTIVQCPDCGLSMTQHTLLYIHKRRGFCKAVTKEEPEKKVPVPEQPIVQQKPKITEDVVNDYIKENPDVVSNYLRNERAMKAQRKQMNARSLLNNAF